MGYSKHEPPAMGNHECGRMRVIIWKPRSRLPKSIKQKLCECIAKNYMAYTSYWVYIHFDYMNCKTGFYSGFVDTWQGWRVNRRRDGKRRKYFRVQVVEREQ